jgi:hypothetical protein
LLRVPDITPIRIQSNQNLLHLPSPDDLPGQLKRRTPSETPQYARVSSSLIQSLFCKGMALAAPQVPQNQWGFS